MKRLPLAIPILLLGVALAPAVSADAPVGGPDQQYANFVRTDSIITDRWTKLQWERPVPARKTFDEAKAYCKAPMRLPSLKELLTLVDEEGHEFYDEDKLAVGRRYIDRLAFPNTPAEPFWTSSRKGSGDYWTVDFATGETGFSASTTPRRVRCVHYVP